MARKKKAALPPGSRVGRTVKQALAALGLGDETPKQAKYRNQPVEVDGARFDSKKEARRWGELLLLQKAGVITNLRRQVQFPLTVNGLLIAVYIADFCYLEIETGRERTEDVKGVRTPAYILKRKLLLALRGIKIIEL